MSAYCDVAPDHPIHGPYHDLDYGFPRSDEESLFERLTLEIAQAGLSWRLILERREGYRVAFANWDIDTVAEWGPDQVERLVLDPGIIRNRLKIEATLHNARVIHGLRASHGGFHAWLETHHPRSKPEWVALFKRTFRFTGGEITGEFLMSLGWLPGAHRATCPVFGRILELEPPWVRAPGNLVDPGTCGAS